MKGLLYIIALSMLAVLISVIPVPAVADDMSPFQAGMTCGGFETTIITDRYFFGLKGADGSCTTLVLLANSREEAAECARKLCPKCEVVEDITDLYRYTVRVSGTGIESYCPANK